MSPLILGLSLFLAACLAIWMFSFRRRRGERAAGKGSLAPRSFGKAISSWIPLLQSNSKDLNKWEQVLIESDLGPRLTSKILEEMKASSEAPTNFLKTRFFDLISQAEVREQPWLNKKPWVLFLVGVNGVGKTTTLVKLAHFFLKTGKSVGVL